MMQFRKIEVATSKLERLTQFYKHVLELDVLSPSANEILIRCGKSDLLFHQTGGHQNPYYHLAFNVPSNQFESAYGWLESRTKLNWLPEYNGFVAEFVNWNARSVYFEDPAGNILELICRRDVSDNASENFSSRQIRCISEVGIVLPADDFANQANILKSKYDLPYFDKQPPLSTFQALGDDEGLFILVPEGRIWFGSDKKSCMYELTVNFENNGELRELTM